MLAPIRHEIWLHGTNNVFQAYLYLLVYGEHTKDRIFYNLFISIIIYMLYNYLFISHFISINNR